MTRPWALASLLLSLSAAGCATPRLLSGLVSTPSFVREPATVYVDGEAGLRRISLDGTGARDVFPPGYKVLDLGPDGRTFVLTDRETNLVVGDGETGQLRQIPALARRLAAAAISPDGKRIAAARHADFRQPEGRWTDDDTVLLIDLATAAVETIPPSSDSLATRLSWSISGDALWMATSIGEPQWITIADRKRATVVGVTPPAPLRIPPTAPSATCASTGARLEADGADAVLWLSSPGAARRSVVRVGDGKKWRGEAEHDFSNLTFSPSCANAVFAYQQSLWVVEIASGHVARLAPGFRAFVAPTLHP